MAGWGKAVAHAMLFVSVDFTLSALRFLEKSWRCFAVMENYRGNLFDGQGVSSENDCRLAPTKCAARSFGQRNIYIAFSLKSRLPINIIMVKCFASIFAFVSDVSLSCFFFLSIHAYQ